MEVVRTDTLRVGRPSGTVLWRTSRRLRAGRRALVWTPDRELQPRTYALRLTVAEGGRRRVYGAHRPGTPADGPVVRVQGVDVATARPSYAPGEPADLLIANRRRLAAGGGLPLRRRRARSTATCARTSLAVTPPVRVDWRAHRDAPARLRLLRAGR